MKIRSPFSEIFGFLFFIFSCISVNAATWIRLNQAGYTLHRPKQAVVLSDTDLTGEPWSISLEGKEVLKGALAQGKKGDQIHFSQNYAFLIDFSILKTPGTYTLSLTGAKSESIIIAENPYPFFAELALMHLREMRSGMETNLRNASHLGDSAAIIHIPHGNFSLGQWKPENPSRKVNMQGGHYDAGDFIKFTLNEANLAWHLLSAYEENPEFFSFQKKESLPEILQEAKISLLYLLKTFPDDSTFIIQVGNGEDHEQGFRMPDRDLLDGKRPALSALSQVHMGITAAALARGAQVFKIIDLKFAEKLEEKSLSIYQRATRGDSMVIPYAYEMNPTNPFYRDLYEKDQMALAAVELYFLTQEKKYLEQAKTFAPKSASEVSWADQNFNANFRLALAGDSTAKKRAEVEAFRYSAYFPWNVPDYFTWASLHRWIGMANAKMQIARTFTEKKKTPNLFYGILDYVFGQNNWGIAMIASENLPYSINHVYNSIYRLTGVFPHGALSEGPGDRSMHYSMRKYFETSLPPVNLFEPFNTEVSVFFDHQDDFMIQEASLTGQADFLYMLALASPKKKMNVPPTFQTKEKYIETVFLPDSQLKKFPEIIFEKPLMLDSTHGIKLEMELPKGSLLTAQIRQAEDFGTVYFKREIYGIGETLYFIDYSSFKPKNHSIPFNAARIQGIQFFAETEIKNTKPKNLSFYTRKDAAYFLPHQAKSAHLRMRGAPASLFVTKKDSLWIIKSSPTLKINSLAIKDLQGNLAAKIFPDAKNNFIWSVKTIPSGIYRLIPDHDESKAITVQH